MSNYIIYKFTSPSGKSYIGQTSNLPQRILPHKCPSSKCTLLSNAIRKYGWCSFEQEILLSGLTLDEANVAEEQLILEHNTMTPLGYNLRSGGLNHLISDEVKQRWSATRKGRPRSPEHQAKLNEAARNRIRTPEHEAKLREVNSRPRSPEVRSNMSAAAKGRPKSDTHKQNLAKAGIGRKASAETKQKQLAKKLGRKLFVHVITGERRYFYPPTFVTTDQLDNWISVA